MAYRNRYDEYLRKRQGVLPDAKQWKAADYARISREDGDKEESDSIGTQFDIIDDYIAHNDDITFVDRWIVNAAKESSLVLLHHMAI